MKLRPLIITFILLWLISSVAVPYFTGSLERAGNFGDSFGGVSALFSGLAFALAIYSMVLQQKQSAEFERVTLATLEQQAAAIKLVEMSLKGQTNTAKVAAISALMAQEEQRVEKLRDWGSLAGDEKKYINGIKAAEKKIQGYLDQLRQHAGG